MQQQSPCCAVMGWQAKVSMGAVAVAKQKLHNISQRPSTLCCYTHQ